MKTTRWNGTCERFADADCGKIIEWIEGIYLSEWPQQHPVDDQLRPAMVHDPYWHGFGAMVGPLMAEIGFRYRIPLFVHPDNWPKNVKFKNPMLSVVMPGHSIHPHKDELEDDWVTRVHVPLITNPDSVFIIDGEEFNMLPGSAYRVNISRVHSVENRGKSVRIHFMFDCYDAPGTQ